MAIAITTPAIQPRKLAPIPGGAPVGGSDRVRAMAPDSLEYGSKQNDVVAQTLIRLDQDAVRQEKLGYSPSQKCGMLVVGLGFGIFGAAVGPMACLVLPMPTWLGVVGGAVVWGFGAIVCLHDSIMAQ